MTERKHWNLGAKLALIGAPFVVLGFLSMALTLWISWQLDGGAAAINEAGRMRMQAYRMSLSAVTDESRELPAQVEEFERSVALLRSGDPGRPLLVPWDAAVHQSFGIMEQAWNQFHRRWDDAVVPPGAKLRDDTATFTASIDALVTAIEARLSRWTTLLHLLQLAMMALAVLAATVLLYTGYAFVLEPMGLLKQAIERIQRGDLAARVDRVTSDEFGTLAAGFNGMAGHLQSMYRHLESKVAEKTSELEDKGERLQALYDLTTLVAHTTTLDELARGFVQRLRRVAKADGVVLRWADEANEHYLILACEGLPESMTEAEHCIRAGDCYCGAPEAPLQARVIPIRTMVIASARHCEAAGFETLVSIPIRQNDRLMGEVNMFFHARLTLSEAERSLVDALTAHLAGAMENLRLRALEKEEAISRERIFLARELHDSIAQSLAFLKIQVQLMRDAMEVGNRQQMRSVLGEIDLGVRESYGDVRELLLHFRTRTNAEDIEPALLTTLRKFEHQSGLRASLQMQGRGIPLAPDFQIQVLHIVQEALSNVRKHAHASQVWLDVRQQPQWRFEVRDDGAGFCADGRQRDETHVGLRIMAERAERVGASLEVTSELGRGTSVVLALPPVVRGSPAAVALAQPLVMS